MNLTAVRDEVAVTQAQGLTDPHASLRQQRDQEPVSQPIARPDERSDLLGRQRPGDSSGDPHFHRPGQHWAARGDVMQERPITTAWHPSP